MSVKFATNSEHDLPSGVKTDVLRSTSIASRFKESQKSSRTSTLALNPKQQNKSQPALKPALSKRRVATQQ